MNFNAIPLMQVIQGKMGYMSQRHATLAQNVANADTPGYRARDVAAPDFRRQVAQATSQLPMARTKPGHLQPMTGSKGIYKEYERKLTSETNPNANNVAIEEEMQKLSINQAEYQQATALYRKTVAMFNTAVGRPGGG